ncbi:hypothetical protein [Clostridium estertheticum]|uniref:CdiI immunity protein domain-containing protein n=1 Tax=Clostridium estertheticum TaxID=238834 RepID=A0AA47EJ71_9CLOT|nr:hypothetical protein [Clostridium estertheticum]MBU3153510.1 hypothetical protein [Clostridium estertheticum]WAG60911.1 hypothetical protein LL038_01270 [Clostridium estertheticum]
MQNQDFTILTENLSELYAYDTGCTDSGVKNEELRSKMINCIRNSPEDEFRVFISIYVREKFLIPEAIKEGYGLEDVKNFIEWLDQYMDYAI